MARGPGHNQESDRPAMAPPNPLSSIVLQSAFRVVEPPLASSWSPLHHGLLLLATDVFTHVHPKSLWSSIFCFPILQSLCYTARQIVSRPVSTMPTNNAIHTYINDVVVIGGRSPSRISSPPVGGSVLCLLLVYNWPGELFVAACISLDPSFSVHSSTCFHEA